MDFKRLSTLMSVVGALMLPFSSANAGVVDYTVTNISGNQWRYDYTINNPTAGLAFDEVTIYFAEGAHELLTDATAPAGRDALASIRTAASVRTASRASGTWALH